MEGLEHVISSVEEQVMELARQGANVPQDLWEEVAAFTSAVDWSERWIQGLVAMHVVMLVTIVLLRKNFTAQIVLFIVIAALVLSAETVNTLCREHYWHRFARQNYFDEHGFFMAIMYAGPLLCLGFVQVIIFLAQTASLMVKVKRAQLRQRAQRQQQEQQQAMQNGGDTHGDADTPSEGTGSDDAPSPAVTEGQGGSRRRGRNRRE